MVNLLTIDVEDYWSIFYRDWLCIPGAEPTDAVVRNTRRLLQILNEFQVKATFFILGEVAEKFPELIREIVSDGHEIGVHGFYHKKIHRLSPDEFRGEVKRAKELLENISGQEVVGHRAPAFSMSTETKWALDILVECGFKYDSSVSLIQARKCGWLNFKKEIHTMMLPTGKSIIEVPRSTVSLWFRELGVGGGYMRHFPYLYTKLVIKHIQKKRPAVVYLHPYEIDTAEIDFPTKHLTNRQKKMALRFHKIQVRNRHTVENKIKQLLKDFKFTAVRTLIEKQLSV